MEKENIDLRILNEVHRPYVNNNEYKRIIEYFFVLKDTYKPILFDKKGNINQEINPVDSDFAKIWFIKEPDFEFDTSDLTTAVLYSLEFSLDLKPMNLSWIKNFIYMIEQYPHILNEYNLEYDDKRIKRVLKEMINIV